jgi:hypothetical protein
MADELRVVKINPATDTRLLHFLRAHPQATVYHHPLWLQVLQREYPEPQVVLACEDEESGQLHGFLPLAYTRGLPSWFSGQNTSSRLSSLPRTPLGGPLSIDDTSAELLLKAALELTEQQSDLHLELKTQAVDQNALAQGLMEVTWRPSYVLHFPENPADFRLGNTARRRHRIKGAVKKARQAGLQVRPAEDEEELRPWYQLYLDTMRRRAVPPRPYRLFAAMWEILRPQGLMQLLLAEKDSASGKQIVAGSVLLKFGSTVSYSFTGCVQRDFAMHPHDLIQSYAIQDAARLGYRHYDLGEVAAEAQSLGQFKSKWGAQEQQLYRYYYPFLETADLGSPPFGGWPSTVVRRIWSRMPLPATTWAADRIYRYL